MKKAFEQNVSRSKPRLRIGAALTEAAEAAAATVAPPAPEPVSAKLDAHPSADLGAVVKARAEGTKKGRLSAAEALQLALGTATDEAEPMVREVFAAAAPPVEEIEVQQPAPRDEEDEPAVRRERLKERLKAVRENPRPEPLPPTVAEAGVLAVERITALQTELNKVKALNQALAQDLEGTRRQAERATEEARIRMDEARRLSTEMEGRAKLLTELERELGALEGERDEALLVLQESRQALEGAAKEKAELQQEIVKRDDQLKETLAEEERLATELEQAKSDAESLRRSVDALSNERDTLARQVSSLTAEVTELLEARKALQAVHRALSSAQVR